MLREGGAAARVRGGAERATCEASCGVGIDERERLRTELGVDRAICTSLGSP
jgi:hypothetical protein